MSSLSASTSLTLTGRYPSPRRTCNGFTPKRVTAGPESMLMTSTGWP